MDTDRPRTLEEHGYGQREPHAPAAGEPRWRAPLCFVAAAGLSASVCWLAWLAVPRRLSGSIDIIGYPTYANHNYQPPFWAYRLITYAFPLLAILSYALLARRGPLRLRAPRRRQPIGMIDRPWPDPGNGRPLRTDWTLVPRLGLPAGIVLVAIAAGPGRIDVRAVAGALGYVLAVLAAAPVVRRAALVIQPRRLERGAAVAGTNAVAGSAAALLALWYVSRHTVVVVDGTTRTWSWMPLWLPLLGTGAALAWVTARIRRGCSASGTERFLLITVVGSVGLFLAFSRLPPPMSRLEGFDDSQFLAGTALLAKGYFPWRDLLFIHGLFPDVLQGTFGTAVFGDTAWGANAGLTVLLTPVAMVLLYLLAAWASRNPWFLALVSVGLLCGYLPRYSIRFLLVPLALLVLGETFRRRSPRWAAASVVVLFVAAILAPEISLLAVSGLACVAAAEMVHRDRQASLWRSLRLTRWYLATGTALSVLLAVVLAAYGSLRAFIDYYLVFGPGHNLAGALPLAGETPRVYWCFLVPIGLVLIAIWMTTRRVRRGAAWQPADWVIVASAGFVAVYGEKALGRFDSVHVAQVVTVALPLLIMLLWKGLEAATPRPVARVPERSATSGPDAPAAYPEPPAGPLDPAPGLPGLPAGESGRAPVAPNALPALLAVALVALFPDALTAAARAVPVQHRMSAPTDTLFPRLGYSTTRAVDPVMLEDLRTTLRALAGDRPVFDMTNSLGYVYYLLGREPGTRFAHVSMAIPPMAQRMLIAELEASRPPVVIADTTTMGLPAWDQVANNVRHYLVAEYVLNRYRPVLRTDGNLIMLRRDLPVPDVTQLPLANPPVTRDLWYAGRECAWGASPNFLRSEPDGRGLTLPVASMGRRNVLYLSGYAAEWGSGTTAREVVLVSGRTVVASIPLTVERPDLERALRQPGFRGSGFQFARALPAGDYAVYMLASDGRMHALNHSPGADVPKIEFPDGRVIPTHPARFGRVEMHQAEYVIGRVQLPRGTAPADYDLLTVSTGGTPIGSSTIVVTDAVENPDHRISARALPGSTHLGIRVGSCLPWHGYADGAALYVLQKGGTPVSTVTLSGVRS